MGRGDPERCSIFRAPACRRSSRRARSMARRRSSRGRSDRRHSRRSAGGPGGPGLLPAGRGQEHLRHRLLHADEHRRDALSVEARTAHDGRLSVRRGEAGLRAGRVDRHRRRARAMAARQSRPDREEQPISRRWRGAFPTTAASRSCRLSPASTRRTGMPRRARPDRRPDALRQQGAHRPRGAGGDGLPDPRGARRHDQGHRASPSRSSAPTAAWSSTSF